MATRLIRKYIRAAFFVSGLLFLCTWFINGRLENNRNDELEMGHGMGQDLEQGQNLGQDLGVGNVLEQDLEQGLGQDWDKGNDLGQALGPNAKSRDRLNEQGVDGKRPSPDETHGNAIGKDQEDREQKPKAAPVQIPIPVKIEEPGAMGKPFLVNPSNLSAAEKEEYDNGFKSHAFNIFASDRISLDRSLPEVRTKECFGVQYRPDKDLPKASVIIIFHNEAWSILLRTIHSVIHRSPVALLHEVILVDDCSDMAHLQTPLDEYIARWNHMRVLRVPKRMGLVHARILGTEAAVAPILVFLDSHCECAAGWLEPLLDRIVDGEHNVVMPVIDIINDESLAYEPRTRPELGGFTWGLGFTWHPIPPRVEKGLESHADPIPTPTMPGGLFAISKQYFLELGLYDQQLQIWGGENMEISFKIWMCGGRMEFIPCSHVGHIFRKRSPYKWKSDKVSSNEDIMKFNLERVAEVWMDEYKEFYYQTINFQKIDHGDISEQKALREKLQCKSFDWYIKTIYPEMFLPNEALAEGEIRNEASGICVDHPSSSQGKAIGTYPCHGGGGNQMWFLSKNNEIRRDDECWDNGGMREIIMYGCHGIPSKQIWTYREDNHIYHGMSGNCVELAEDGKSIYMAQCKDSTPRQVWLFHRKNQQN